MGEGSPWILYLSGVMVAAWCGGPATGFLATVLSALACDAFFFGSSLLSSPLANERIRLALFVAEGTLISALTGSLHAARKQAEETLVELTVAYDASIEGWGRILDLRDRETQGHSRRVAEMTVRVAREMGIDDAELVHVRRGALLHDIGKLGIPDAILHKPGPLAAGEWADMQSHPRLAQEWLSSIPFLGPALEIPYCHHERWDGTGYPRGLMEEEIPLTARIFAAVDIWDALLSDRPYRPRWSEPRVLEHLASLSGTHLDPKVVGTFLRLLAEDARSGHARCSCASRSEPEAGSVPESKADAISATRVMYPSGEDGE